MKTKEKNNIIFIRLYPGEDLNVQLIKACKLHNIKSAVVISGIGQLKNIHLGYFKEKGDYSPECFKDSFELLSISGNICKDKEGYLLHLHAVIGDEKKNVFGGHFISGIVEITCEIVILKTNMDATRVYDEKTCLKALFLE